MLDAQDLRSNTCSCIFRSCWNSQQHNPCCSDFFECSLVKNTAAWSLGEGCCISVRFKLLRGSRKHAHHAVMTLGQTSIARINQVTKKALPRRPSLQALQAFKLQSIMLSYVVSLCGSVRICQAIRLAGQKCLPIATFDVALVPVKHVFHCNCAVANFGSYSMWASS